MEGDETKVEPIEHEQESYGKIAYFAFAEIRKPKVKTAEETWETQSDMESDWWQAWEAAGAAAAEEALRRNYLDKED